MSRKIILRFPILVCLAAIILTGCVTATPAGHVTPPRIALVGDSWPVLMRVHRGFSRALIEEGYHPRQVRYVAVGFAMFDGPGVSLSGAGLEADVMNSDAFKRKIERVLERFPTIDIIHLSAGGADLLHDVLPSMTPDEQTRYMREVIIPNVEALLQYFLEVHPNKHLALVGYDYLNLRDPEHDRTLRHARRLEGADAQWVNEKQWQLNELQRELAAAYPDVLFVDHLGGAKKRLGVPDDFSEPNPLEAVWVDGLHLDLAGNVALARRCLDLGYRDWLMSLRDGRENVLRKEGRY